ncbi:MAG: hypothetical protein O3A55_05565 [Bacteroidetes bacterium]|nr:hypothetical protein [Bacteroidota bacterium]
MAKSKFRIHFCENCKAEKKMQILGAVEGNETKVWHKCSRCRHNFLIDTGLLNVEEKKDLNDLVKEECSNYNPINKYEVGASIYHSDWDDMGIVTSKVKISSGLQAIIVEFQKNGNKKLIENLQED